jgi:hypothetical protein
MRKVRKVTRVKARVIRSKPPRLVVVAEGIASTPGWTRLSLSEYIYIRPPSDGILSFDFVGNPPSKPVPQVEKKVRASKRTRAPKWLKGVRVYAAQNSKVARV